MKLKVLGISSSPRAKGNTDLLAREALAGAESAGAEVSFFGLRSLNISPCTECDSCRETGSCRIEDDFQKVLSQMLEADRLIFATPVFFMSVTAQAKMLIDRCQCLWARKYVLKQPLFARPDADRRALVISVAGSKTRNTFHCVENTVKYFFDVLEMNYTANLFVSQIDAKGEILRHPTAMKEAFRLGTELANPNRPIPSKPVTTELFQAANRRDRKACRDERKRD